MRCCFIRKRLWALHKFTATLVSTCFIALNIFNSVPAFAFSVPLETIVSQNTQIDLKTFSLPPELGQIEISRLERDPFKPSVILIQDAHGVPSAQVSLRNILRHLAEHYGVQNTALEGTSDALDPLFFQAFPDSPQMENLFQKWVEDGELSGAAWHAVEKSGQDTHFFGIENAALYEQGRQAYLNGVRKAPDLQKKLSGIRARIWDEQAKTYAPDLKMIVETQRQLESARPPLAEILNALLKTSPQSAPAIAVRYPRLGAVMMRLHPTSLDSSSAIQRELMNQSETLWKQTHDQKDLVSKLNRARQAFRTGEISAPEFAWEMANLEKKSGRHNALSPALREMIEQQKLIEHFKGGRFLQELNAWIEELKKSRYRSGREKELDLEDQALALFIRGTRFEWTLSDWKIAQNTKRLPGDLSRDAFGPFFNFYEIAEKRETAMFERLTSSLKSTTAVVIGGFHTAGFQERLRRARIPFVVVSPSIAFLPERSQYESLMKDQTAWRQNRSSLQAGEDLYREFAQATRNQVLKDSKRPESLRWIWQDRILKALDRQGRLQEASYFLSLLNPDESRHPQKNQVLESTASYETTDLQPISADKKDLPANISWMKATQLPKVTLPLARRHSVNRPVAVSRSELRHILQSSPTWVSKNAPILNDYTVVSRQFEAGLHDGILEQIAADPRYGKPVMRWIAQSQMTGGLGALMHDLADAWKKNGVDVIMMNNLYELGIKGRGLPEPLLKLYQAGETLGGIMRKFMDPTGIKLRFILRASDEFRSSARGASAEDAVGREISVEVYRRPTKIAQTPSYYFYAYYFNDAGEQVPINKELYPDNKAERAVEMVVYNLATQKLQKALQEKGLAKPKTLYVNNEVYVSLPTEDRAPRHDLNHSVLNDTIPKLDPASYRMAGLAEEDREAIVHDGQLYLTEVVGLESDRISSVSLFEHEPVLKDVFAPYRHKVDGYRQNGMRSTNGALFDKWQTPERRALIQQYKEEFKIPPEANDQELFKRLEQEPRHRAQYQIQNEWIAAQDVAVLLNWLAAEQQNSTWRSGVLQRYQQKTQAAQPYPESLLDELIQDVQNAMLQSVKNPEPWESLEARWGTLRDILMEDPIVSNVRRQVEYKGPVAWEEILSSLVGNPEAIRKFREEMPRIIIGGRTFGDGAYWRFERIKSLIKQLGLEDRVATVEDYNINEAPIIFRAMAGSVMLSHEFLEASATSMMKALSNYGALIGVWGGADPELFTIEDNAGNAIDPFQYSNEHKIPFDQFHDFLVRKLHSKEWKITNGFLIEYSEDRNGTQWVGTRKPRKPSTESLKEGLRGLRNAYRTPESRRELQWNVSKSSWKVDMEKGQARAHIKIWEEILEKKATEESFFSGLNLSPSGTAQILNNHTNGFWFRRALYPPHQALAEEERSASGFLEFFSGFHRLRVKGEPAFWSVLYHSGNHHKLGDFVRYFRDYFEPVKNDPSFQPIFKQLLEYARRLKHAKSDEDRGRINLELIDFMEKTAQYMSFVILQSYIFSPPEEQIKLSAYFQDRLFLNALMRYLDHHPLQAASLDSTSDQIKLYQMMAGPRKVVVGFNDNWTPSDASHAKDWATIYGLESLKAILGEEAVHQLADVYQVKNLTSGEVYREHAVWQMRTFGIPVGIMKQQRIQVLQFEATTQKMDKPISPTLAEVLPELLRAAIAGEFVDETTPPAELISQLIRQNRNDPVRLKELLRSVVTLPAVEAQKAFGRENIQTVMAFVAALAPDLLSEMNQWDGAYYPMLEAGIQGEDNQELFRRGDIDFPETNRKTALVISRSLDGRRLFIPIHFANSHYRVVDSKIELRISNLGAYQLFSPDSRVKVRDWTLRGPSGRYGKVAYPTVRQGNDLFKAWTIGVSQAPGKKDGHGIDQHGGRFQILEFVDAETEQPLQALQKTTALQSGQSGRSEVRKIQPIRQSNAIISHTPTLRAFARFQERSSDFASAEKLDLFSESVTTFLEQHPTEKLRFAWMMPWTEDANVQKWVRGFFERMQALEKQTQYHDRISVRVAMIPSESIHSLARLQMDFPEFVEIISTESRLKSGRSLHSFLSQHPNALFHGMGSLESQIRLDQKFRQIDFDAVDWEDVFPLLAHLYFMSAQSESLRAEEIEALPKTPDLQTYVGIQNGRLTVFRSAREWDFKFRTERMIATMA